MTVQQQYPTTAATLPAPRPGSHDAGPLPPVVRRPEAWTSPEERLMCRLMVLMMLGLSLFAALMVWLSARVW